MALAGTRHSIVDPVQGLNWRPGWTLRPLQSGIPAESAFTIVTGELPGHFVLISGSHHYPLTLSASPAPNASARLLADMAYAFESDSGAQHQRLIWTLILEKDRALGYISGDQPPHILESRQIISGQNLTLYAVLLPGSSRTCYLAYRKSAGGIRFVLFLAADYDRAAVTATSSLEADPLQILVGHLQQRRQWAPPWTFRLDQSRRASAAAAHEILRACLRSPAGRLKNVWVAEAPTGAARFVVNDLFPLCDIMSRIDPALAACILRSALCLQRNDGGFPAWYNPNTDTAACYSSLPVIVQCALLVVRSLEKPTELLDEIIDPLINYLNWTDRRYFNPMYNACVWPDEDESLIPELYDSQALAPDATALYLAELVAFKELIPDLARVIPQLSFDLEARAEQLRHSLSTVLRTADSGFRAILSSDGTEIRRVSIAQLLPVAVSDQVFPPPSRYWLRRSLFDHRLVSAGGVLAWEKWDEDDIEPRIDLRAEFHLLAALAAADFTHEAESIAVMLLPERAEVSPQRVGDAEPTAVQERETSLGACLVLKALSILASEISPSRQPGTRRSEISSALSPARKISLGLVGLLLSVLVALGGLLALRAVRRPPVVTLRPRLALADYDYWHGNPERAIPTYEVYFRIRPSFATSFRLGNAWYKAGNYTNAIYWYNKALEMKPDYLPALLNRGLCWIRLNASSLALRDFALATELAARRGSASAFRRSSLAAWLTRARLQQSADSQNTPPE